ncbi:MAG: Penicillin-binding protein 2D [Chloroflexi bacterium]|nr:Penicillin-binding protein 2D [Chloroflexota bacterium]
MKTKLKGIFKARPPSPRLLIPLLLLLLFIPLTLLITLTHDLPDVDTLPDRLNAPSIRVEDRNGQLLYESLSEEGGRHTVLSLDEISPHLQQATLATEDRNFYQHPGVDIWGIARAFWINLRGREVLAGGSTITQQVARGLLFTPEERFENTLRRKLRESLLAWRLTRRYTKDEILALYLNQSYYGGLSYGVEAAAQTYFGKPAAELDVAESALLAGLPQAPSLYNPLLNPEAAQERQRVVLGLMEKEGFLTAEERELAEGEPLAFTASPYPMEAPHFVLWARAQVDDLLTPEDLKSSLTVRTTLDLTWQHHAERAIQKHLQTIQEDKSGLGHNVHNAALVALDTHTGAIRALVGSPDYFDQEIAGAVNMALTPRQPGSALKPFIYAAAFDPAQADPWTPSTMILDVPRNFTLQDGKSYAPKNYDNRFHGPVLVREALASSYNIPAVAALEHIGLETLYGLGADLGLSTLDAREESDLSLALGGDEVSLLELTAAYGAFSNRGYRLIPFAIASIHDSQGNLLYEAAPSERTRVLDPRVAWLISDILSDNTARTPGFGPNSALLIDRPAAVKTGTTSNFHDNWTIGYTPGYTPDDTLGDTPGLAVGVWVGNTDHEPMLNVDGLSGAAPIWHQFIRTVLRGVPETDFDRPPGLERVRVCTLSGLLPSEACPYQRLEWFIDGTQPTQVDTFYREVEIDTTTGALADADTPPEHRRTVTVLNLPPEARAWARGEGIPLFSDLDTQQSPNPEHPLLIISPGPNTTYYLSTDVPAATQRIHIEALLQGEAEAVTLWVDGEEIATFTHPPYETWWPAQTGEHQTWAEATTPEGDIIRSERVNFTVKAKSDE